MINTKEYIESGILELYVAGILNREDSYEVYSYIQQYPEIKEYVKSIEQKVVKIAEVSKPKNLKAPSFTALSKSIKRKDTKVIPIRRYSYVGWAASIVFAIGLFGAYVSKQTVDKSLTEQIASNETLQEELISTKLELNTKEEVIAFMSSKETLKIDLAGQKVAPESYAAVYWDKNKDEMYLDLSGLPPAPEGKVYQLWSLTLNPLTPTSLGTLDAYNNGDRFIKVNNTNASQAFGITLEPVGGSVSPTLEQLYTLGLTKVS
ncbi:anti-sigma factor [Wenyingzhuangia sp. IMCC45574]